jgi:hypothetical protein
MRRKKLSRSDRQFWKDHGIDPGVPESDSMTTEQLMEKVLQDVKQMSSDEKAHCRAKLDRSLGIPPKTSKVKFQ